MEIASVIWNLCHSHHLVTLESEYPELRVDFVLENLRTIWAFRESNLMTERDPARDFVFRLFDITMTAVAISEQYRSMSLSNGTTLSDELRKYVSKCLKLILQLVGASWSLTSWSDMMPGRTRFSPVETHQSDGQDVVASEQ